MPFKIGSTTVLSGDSVLPVLDTVDYNSLHEGQQIGTQIWMVKNLNVTHYRDGTPIFSNIEDDVDWENAGIAETGAYCIYDDIITAGIIPWAQATWGKLYNWYAVDGNDGGGSGTRELAPEGWHIATAAEWDTLNVYLGGHSGSKVADSKYLWASGDMQDSSDFAETGFGGLPGGLRADVGTYLYRGDSGYFWTATAASGTNGDYWKIEFDEEELYNSNVSKAFGKSVRCIKDT